LSRSQRAFVQPDGTNRMFRSLTMIHPGDSPGSASTVVPLREQRKLDDFQPFS
jgi:hypothetical protein